MLVIADAGPLIALEDIGRLDLLQSLYGEVLITDVVRKEVLADLPDWIHVESAYDQASYRALQQQIDAGEASAIALAVEKPDCLLVMDEKRGRKVAKSMGVKVIGLLGVLLEAKHAGLIASGTKMLEELEAHGFWLSKKLKDQLIKNLGE